MSAKSGFTLIEIVLCLGIMTIIFAISTAPALYVYRKLITADEYYAAELLGTKIIDVSARAFIYADLYLVHQSSAHFSREQIRLPLSATSPCGSFNVSFDFVAPTTDGNVACGNHKMEIKTSGKINIVLDTMD